MTTILINYLFVDNYSCETIFKIKIKENETEKENNIKNILSETLLLLAFNLHTDSISKGSRSPRGHPYKKEKKIKKD
jgi:D-Tyr-tRNAtyr deacylase